ncbi:hypothetical protein PPSIR1_05508 [Plesiocystis pacifica SIR-1]|uniref:Primosomal protein N' (Replication factor Y)-superfamily II helicase n=1 Tax=Plesiocystis pacifica SIR-1 TaxID=391625 RepID=A6FX74_9BACT|nr:hypothetical protein [Plesiocystis pacifica]EDM81898.1 hypothetical protein PPSIR1_05508 [Plesiocystis pacifica SIR-1]
MPTAERPHQVRSCTGCGATVEFGRDGLSTRCPYCCSSLVDAERGAAGVDAVVPFRVPSRGALDQLRAHVARGSWAGFWAPKWVGELIERGPMREDGRGPHGGLRGVLVPFWVYEGVVRSDYHARVGVDWTRELTRKNKDGESETKEIRETEWFRLTGSAVNQIEDHLVCASVGLPKAEAQGLGSYDLGWAVDFDPRLLSGFEAELPSIGERRGDAEARAEMREAEAKRIVDELLPGDHNRLSTIQTAVELHGRRLVLLPVWIASYRQDASEVLRLVVNGQTGQVGGRVPVDWRKVAVAVTIVALLAGLIALVGWWQGWWPEPDGLAQLARGGTA